MGKIQESELRRYTVRLRVADRSGTGFFVAPGLLLTCYHVVREAEGSPIQLSWQGEDYTATIDKLPTNTEIVDLALLRCDRIPPNCPWVVFDALLQNGDRLYTFGYTDDYPNGDPSDFTYIDLTGDEPPLIKFKLGQVQPGFSGSPLLNLRTGRICGVVNKSRDIYTDLGGRAIPVSVIFEIFPELYQPPIIPENPFIPRTGRIENEALLFGREREINRIFETLNSGSSVALIGDREVGKSSLLWAIYRRAEHRLKIPRRPIYLNLNDVYDEDDFYDSLCTEVGIEVCKGSRLKRGIRRQNPPLLLILDELEKMTWNGFTNQVRGQLRGLAEGNDAPLRLVVAASTSLDRLFPDSAQIGMTSPFHGLCIEEPIRGWDETIIGEFIRHRLEPTPIRFSDEEITSLVRQSRGHPKTLMQLCYDLYNRYRQQYRQPFD